ncbi:unnamed protein product, partial [Prorocentrum cordatum]
MEGTSGQHYLQAVSDLKAVKASTLAAKPWDQQRMSMHDQLEVTKKKLSSAQHECDKTCEAIVALASDFEKQIQIVADLTSEVQQLETQHKMAVQQELKEHACKAPSLESLIPSQFPPGLAPSAEAPTAVAQLAAKLRVEWQAAQVDGGPPTPAGPGAADGAADGAGISPEEAAAYDKEEKAMEVEELNAEQKRLAGIKRAGEAVGQVLNLHGQNLPQSSQQQENTEALQKSAKALCVAAARGKGGEGDPADKA